MMDHRRQKPLQRRRQTLGALDPAAGDAIGLGVSDEVGVAEVRPKSGKPSAACFQRIIP